MATAKKSQMSREHKAALAEGREQSRSVKRYLEALEASRPKRGRKRSPSTIRKRLEAIEEELPEANLLKALNLRQERKDLSNELASLEHNDDLKQLEADFVKAAGPYAERKNISYAVWREAGVPVETLRKAGITRGS